MRRPLLALVLVPLVVAGCRRQTLAPSPPPPPATTQQPAPQAGPAAAPAPVEGGELNRLFPPARSGTLERVFTQEKPGFALAEVLRDGKKVALLSIVDTLAAGGTAEKPGTRSIAGFPATDTGSMQTSVLVAGRYKVVVRSTDASFGPGDRDRLIESVDLKGLVAMAGGAK